jgi:hypothetical protein
VDSIGCFGYASAVSHDMNDDGIDEVIFTVNDFICNPPKVMGISDIENDHHSVRLLDPRTRKLTTITQPMVGKNVSTTPWIGDLDSDQKLDLVYNMQRTHYEVDEFRGMYLVKLSSNIKIEGQPTWGAYMGNDRTGVFKARKKKPA